MNSSCFLSYLDFQCRLWRLLTSEFARSYGLCTRIDQLCGVSRKYMFLSTQGGDSIVKHLILLVNCPNKTGDVLFKFLEFSFQQDWFIFCISLYANHIIELLKIWLYILIGTSSFFHGKRKNVFIVCFCLVSARMVSRMCAAQPLGIF